MMKEKMGYAMDETNDVEKRIEALDDFEMVCLQWRPNVGYH